KELLFSVQNSRKARLGGLQGLQDPAFMAQKQEAEKTFRAAVAKDPKLADAATAWDRIEKANKTLNAHALNFNILERGIPFSSLFSTARTLVRSAEERTKPNGERLREYTDSNKPSLEQQLFSEAPIYDDLEQLLVASALSFAAEQSGMENELVQKILA